MSRAVYEYTLRVQHSQTPSISGGRGIATGGAGCRWKDWIVQTSNRREWERGIWVWLDNCQGYLLFEGKE